MEHPDVRISPVHETCLVGTVSATWAAQRLAAVGLAADDGDASDGTVTAAVCAQDAAFHGLAFREAILMVNGRDQATLLVQGVESRPWFARVERRRNHAPYDAGTITRSATTMDVRVGDTLLLTATVSAAPTSPGRYLTVGELYGLPGWRAAIDLSGSLLERAFDPATDTFTPGSLLQEAGFTPKSWWVGDDGVHARGKVERYTP